MLPSSTVENYLKAIYQAQIAQEGEGRYVPMGHLASALGVVPGTATTMVKALADSGLVNYEPYVGVRLTPAGEKLAALVLRRHRLVEQFLVQVMGMNWTEVHDEAEALEHAVSDRLIERMDAMLGRPSVDPHGDPIPDPEGALPRHDYQTLLTCPLNTPVIVTRVVDQDAEFLRFLETHDLKPGQSIEVEARDSVADAVGLRSNHRRVTIGSRAASKLLVEVVTLLWLVMAGPDLARAQTAAPTGSNRPFEILDNSFLVEEAFNQESGVVQNIVGFVRGEEATWDLAFTQEWPVRSLRHQISYTVPFTGHSGQAGVGDMLINYRYQVFEEGPRRPAFAPRISLLVPTGKVELDPDPAYGTQTEPAFGSGSTGIQLNLPFSKQAGDFYVHWNGGLTYVPFAESPRAIESPTWRPAGESLEVSLLSGHLAASGIWRMRPMVNLMLEALVEFNEEPVTPGRTGRTTVLTLAPGIRGGWNLGEHQMIIGSAIPIGLPDDGDATVAVFGYFSYELPFLR